MTVKELTSKAEFDALRSSTRFVILEAYATWNGDCRFISPVSAQSADNYTVPGTYVFARVDVDSVPELGAELEISLLPAFFPYKNCEIADGIVGSKHERIEELVKAIFSEARA